MVDSSGSSARQFADGKEGTSDATTTLGTGIGVLIGPP